MRFNNTDHNNKIKNKRVTGFFYAVLKGNFSRFFFMLFWKEIVQIFWNRKLLKELHWRFQEKPGPLLGFEVVFRYLGFWSLVAFRQGMCTMKDVPTQSGGNVFQLLLYSFIATHVILVSLNLFQCFFHVLETARRWLDCEVIHDVRVVQNMLDV